MKKNIGWIILVILLVLMLVLSGIFNAYSMLAKPATATVPAALVDEPTRTPASTSTPDLCSPANIESQVARVHSLTREFEDTAQILTSTLFRDTSVPLVQELQRVRRLAEDQVVPSCLQDLKAYQIAHMNARLDVFGTTLAFMNQYGTDGSAKLPDGSTLQDALNYVLQPLYIKADTAARQYESEYYRLLGMPTPVYPTMIPVTSAP